MSTKNILLIILGLVSILAGAIIFTNKNNSTGVMDHGDHEMVQHGGSNDAMREHCQMMSNMAGCEMYRDGASANTTIDRSIAGLSPATEQKSINVANGKTYDIEASFVKKEVAGKTIRMLAYNGQVPGPILKVKQGDAITINFKNSLDEDTTIHWHGIRVENKFDGVPYSTQAPIKPGESFTYNVSFPDAGLYWYHPHTREDYEQELGLYGLIWVEPKDASYFNPVNRQEFLQLDDILMGQSDIVDFNKNGANHTLMGRFGNTMFINGKERYDVSVHKGEAVRFAVVNTANARPFNLTLPGIKFKLVGGDSGVYDQETYVDSVIVSPSERVIIEALFDKPGTYQIINKTPNKTTALGAIHVGNATATVSYVKEFNTLRTNLLSDAMALVKEYQDKPVNQTINLTVSMSGMGGMDHGGMGHGMMGSDTTNSGGIEWEDTMAMMNAESTNQNMKWIMQDNSTKKENMDINYIFTQGDKVKIRLFNDPKSMHPMQHPMHFHGNRFLVLSVNGVKTSNPVWKDTVLVPSGATVDILLDASNPGTWMAHCHIAEHLQASMMIGYAVK